MTTNDMDREALIKEMNKLKAIHAKTGIIKIRDRIIEIQNELKQAGNPAESKKN